MPVCESTQFMVKRNFDAVRSRHSINGITHVLHCHHYLSLYTQLAEDCGFLDGRKLLREVCEDVFYGVLTTYYQEHGIAAPEERISIGEQYYAFSGLGQMKVTCAGCGGGEVELSASHVDAGWIRKWGKSGHAVNHVTCGYLAALFAAVYGTGRRSYLVNETASIVTGAPCSRFSVVAD